VKWTDERSTSFLSDSHGRAQQIHCELALDGDGKFLAVKVSGYGNLGAYITGVAPSPLSLNVGKNLASVYRTPLMSVDIKTVLTNTTLMGAYRGAGRPEANYFMERLIDRAADEMGINRLTASDLLDRAAAVGPTLEAAKVTHVLVAHILQRLARQRGSPAGGAVHDHGFLAIELLVVVWAFRIGAELKHTA